MQDIFVEQPSIVTAFTAARRSARHGAADGDLQRAAGNMVLKR